MAERNVDLLDPDNRERVEVAESDQSTDAANDTEERAEKPVKTLIQRMASIRKEASGIGKEEITMETKAGKTFKIHGHTIEGVLHGIRALFDKHGVWMLPNLVSREYNGNRCDVKMEFHFVNVDDPDDRMMLLYAGADTDNGGKGFAKAGTNALKEMLKKVFLITDREDAKEETDVIEYRSTEGATRAEVDDAQNQARAALMQWANTFKSALESAKTKKDVMRIARESRDQLTSPDLPDVTRTFFEELIEKQKEALPE